MVDSKSRWLQRSRSSGQERTGSVGGAQGRGGALRGAGPGAGLSLLVKRQPPIPRRRERGAACPHAGPGADPGPAGRGAPVSGLGAGWGRREYRA